jgi:hypothetical protein
VTKKKRPAMVINLGTYWCTELLQVYRNMCALS